MGKNVTNIQALSYQKHRQLKVRQGYAAEYGDGVDSVVAFPNELGDLQREYPLVLRKDADTGEFGLLALLGLEQNENLFISQKRWHARYIPLAIARGPFVVGYQDQTSIGGSEQEPVIYVDINHPKINDSQGEVIFNSDGQLSGFMQNMNRSLLAIHQGVHFSRQMIALFKQFDLIEAVNLEIELSSGEKIQLQGNYTIHQQRLAGLNGEALFQLNQSGFLQGAFLIAGSLSNIQRLIDLKNAREQ